MKKGQLIISGLCKLRRIHNEEQVLAAGLPGYTEYQQRVRWRLIPKIW